VRAKVIVLGIVCCVLAVGFLAACGGVMMGDYAPVRKEEEEARERQRGLTALVLLAVSGGSFVAGVICFVKGAHSQTD
jgi:hypothetical protein